MKPTIYHLEFLTPCFCAGADQAVAEVRAPSIRGKLRWWFRILGGNPTQEAEVFGSIRGDESLSSPLVVRVREDALKSQWQPIDSGRGSNTGYLLYFAMEARGGRRWVAGGALPVGSAFELQILWRRTLNGAAKELFDLALECFLFLGSIGLRSTRGLGCFTCREKPYSEVEWKSLLVRINAKSAGFKGDLANFIGPQTGILDALGAQLRGLRLDCSAVRQGHSNPTPLGTSNKPRQTSAVYLRPVRESTGECRLVVFEAPADKVLGIESRLRAPLLGKGVPSPGQAPQGGRRF